MTTQARTWDESLTAAIDFVRVNGRYPSPSTGTPEGTQYNWIAHQRRSASAERAAILDEKLPRWRGKHQRRSWEESLALTAAYVAKNGKNPAQTDPDPEVVRLAFWLREQRMTAPDEKVPALDAAIPGWRGNHPGHRSWEESLAAVLGFVNRNGRMPKKGGGEEGRLGSWVADQRYRADDDQRARLDVLFPGWSDLTRDVGARLEEVKAFHAAEGRFPRPCDTGRAGKLGAWLSSQRQMAGPNTRAALDAALPGWHVTLESQWETTLARYADFVSTRGRRPRVLATEPDELSLARWMQKQRSNAKGERAARLDTVVPGWNQPSRSKAPAAAYKVA